MKLPGLLGTTHARTNVSRRRTLGLLGASALAAGGARPVRAADLTVVNVGSALADDLTPALYAAHAGLFQKAGLDVRIQIAQSGAALGAALVGGALDIGKSSLMTLMSAYAHGIVFKIIAGAAVFSAKAPTGQLVVVNPAIRTAADMNGKIVAMSALKALDHLCTLLYVDQNGGNSATLKFIELSYAEMMTALASGRADIASVANPTLQTLLDSGKVTAIADPYVALGQRFMFAAWFASGDYVARNASVVSRFAQAIHEATIFTNAHPADTVDIVAEFTHIDVAVIRKMNRLQSAPSVDPNEIQMLIDTAAKYKFIDAAFPAKEIIAPGIA
jgi:NitT/TauT family transport system substrate-binding protein